MEVKFIGLSLRVLLTMSVFPNLSAIFSLSFGIAVKSLNVRR